MDNLPNTLSITSKTANAIRLDHLPGDVRHGSPPQARPLGHPRSRGAGRSVGRMAGRHGLAHAFRGLQRRHASVLGQPEIRLRRHGTARVQWGRSVVTRTQIAGWTFWIGVCLAFYGYTVHEDHSQAAVAAADAKRGATEMAVSVLPPGVETAWNAYLDRQFARAFQPQGDVVRVRSSVTDLTSTTILISRNSPYQVVCDPGSGWTIEFGQGDSATSVTMYGLAKTGPRPPLGVAKYSIAAKRLSEATCARMAAHMHDVMQRPR